jgi:hypothetical protein
MYDFWIGSLVFTQYVCYLISIIVGIKLLRYFDISLKLIFSLLCLGLMTDVISLSYTWILKKQNLFIINIYSLLEFASLSLFYIININSLFFKRLIFLFLLIYNLISLFEFYTNSVSSIAYYKIAALENFLVSFYAICFFVFSMKHNPEKISTKYPLFRINSGILVYYMPFIIIYLFTEYLYKISNLFITALINNFNNILTVILITLIIIGFLKSKSQNPNVNLNS